MYGAKGLTERQAAEVAKRLKTPIGAVRNETRAVDRWQGTDPAPGHRPFLIRAALPALPEMRCTRDTAIPEYVPGHREGRQWPRHLYRDMTAATQGPLPSPSLALIPLTIALHPFEKLFILGEHRPITLA